MTTAFDLGGLFMQRDAESRSISAENPTGEPGRGAMAIPEGEKHPSRELGRGWKVRACVPIGAGETLTIMNNAGPGIIRHIWCAFEQVFCRDLILRIYWDGEENPSVEAPVGDFFCNSWNLRQNILAIPINVNPTGGFNSYFPMPFRKHARITVQNMSPNVMGGAFFYTINYTLEDVPDDALYFHASWRRSNPLEYGKEYLIVDGIKGRGQYVGTFMSWQQNNSGWWGEGEVKMYLDGDRDFPSICGTGTEDYFGGAWGFGANYSAPYLGFQNVAGTPGTAGARITLYRFHVPDPIFFKSSLKVTMQALGWRSEGRFLPLQDDIASVAYWYQCLPHAPFPPFADRNAREII